MKKSIDSRRRRYFELSSRIAQIDGAELNRIAESSDMTKGWGRNHVMNVGGAKVFVKRIPMTAIEHEQFLSTRNLYDLPTFYNYGVGSAGFGISRELVAHIKTTNWVLDGQAEGFPLMYHYRVLPFFGEKAPADEARQKRYVEYWAGNENIGRYMLDRAAATHELALYLEYVPFVLDPWLRKRPGRTSEVVQDLFGTIDFLRSKGLIHFDAHFHNILTDGERCYLTDFGLVADRSFDLSPEEAAFFKAHTFYDYGEVIAELSFHLRDRFNALPDDKKASLLERLGVAPDTNSYNVVPDLVRNMDELGLRLNPDNAAVVRHFREPLLAMRGFFTALQTNNDKSARFPQAKIRRMLVDAGVVQPSTRSV